MANLRVSITCLRTTETPNNTPSRRPEPLVHCHLEVASAHKLVGNGSPMHTSTEQNQSVPHYIVEPHATLRLNVCTTRIGEAATKKQQQRNVRQIIGKGSAHTEYRPSRDEVK